MTSQDEGASMSSQDDSRCTRQSLESANFTWLPIEGAQSARMAPYQLHASTCEMRRFEEVQDARDCLRGKSIVLVGDSVTR